MAERIAVIRVRGKNKMAVKIEDTLQKLRLYNKNYCTVVPNNQDYLGMIRKVKDYVAWGDIHDDTFSLLVEKRGTEFKGSETDRKNKISYKKFFTFGEKKLNKYFRLNSPRKGYGRKGIKKAFKIGGALGYRGAKINDLILRMI